jgi:hypothetical protein
LQASLHVNYNGFRKLGDDGFFMSPVIAFHFGFSEFECLSRYTNWVDECGFSTQLLNPIPPLWHRDPIFCGWCEQTVIAHKNPLTTAANECTQQNYELWIDIHEERGIPFRTIVIDDKWQKNYGDFVVDDVKWPDLVSFIEKAHLKNQHVLLWIPGHHKEGLPDEWLVKFNGIGFSADVTNPNYENYLREQIKKLITLYGVDGFKVDWTGGLTNEREIEIHGNLFGLEYLHKFHWIGKSTFFTTKYY